MSIEVQNRGISGPTKGLMSTKCLYKKSVSITEITKDSVTFRLVVSDHQEDAGLFRVQARSDSRTSGTRVVHPPTLGQTVQALPADRHRARLEGRPDIHRREVS